MQPKADATIDAIEFDVVTTSDTIVVPYPAGRGPDSYGTGGDHKITGRDFSELNAQLGHITVNFRANDVQIINTGDRTFKAGTSVTVLLDGAGWDIDDDQAPDGVNQLNLVEIALGTPIATDANGAVESQAATAANGLATGINGVLAADGVATFDVPRNVVAAWTGTAVLTVTGTDVNGNVVVESSASGTSLAGAKAFKTVTGIAVSADVTGLTVGCGNVLGLPVYLGSEDDILTQKLDGDSTTAGTTVVGDQADATATTGDVRGTYVPNAAPNGTRDYSLICLLKSQSYQGAAQFAG